MLDQSSKLNGTKLSVIHLERDLKQNMVAEYPASDTGPVPGLYKDLKFKKEDSMVVVTQKDGATAVKVNDSNKSEPSYVVMFLAEVIGTGLLMFLGCMGCMNVNGMTPPYIGGFAFGLTVLLIIQLFGHISGAHLNPGVTLATVLYKILSVKMGLVYIAGQFIGATLGMGLLKVLTAPKYNVDGFCLTKPVEDISIWQALFIEIVISTVLILVCGAVWDKRNEQKSDSVPIRFGLIIVALSIIAGPLTGASMNTARSVAPVIFDGNWKDQWIYLVGPNVGALIGFALYNYIFAPKNETCESEKEEQVHLEDVNIRQNNINDKV